MSYSRYHMVRFFLVPAARLSVLRSYFKFGHNIDTQLSMSKSSHDIGLALSDTLLREPKIEILYYRSQICVGQYQECHKTWLQTARDITDVLFIL
jgi:hypothetical protein